MVISRGLVGCIGKRGTEFDNYEFLISHEIVKAAWNDNFLKGRRCVNLAAEWLLRLLDPWNFISSTLQHQDQVNSLSRVNENSLDILPILTNIAN
jgi:hypothetical protein